MKEPEQADIQLLTDASSYGQTIASTSLSSAATHSHPSRTPSETMLKHLFLNVATLTHVQTVQELPDILVLDSALLLDVGSGLRNVLEGVAVEL